MGPRRHTERKGFLVGKQVVPVTLSPPGSSSDAAHNRELFTVAIFLKVCWAVVIIAPTLWAQGFAREKPLEEASTCEEAKKTHQAPGSQPT